MAGNSTAAEFIKRQTTWQKELTLLRELLLETGMEETIKWGIPVYTVNGKNVVGLGSFASYFGLWFYQGSFLKDPHGVLVSAGESTRGMRQLRYNALSEVDPEMVRAYVLEAIDNQKAGKEIKPEKKMLEMPEEFRRLLDEKPEVQMAFTQLTPGKQREYAEYISQAKREATKVSRLEKITPMILNKVGLHDKYK